MPCQMERWEQLKLARTVWEGITSLNIVPHQKRTQSMLPPCGVPWQPPDLPGLLLHRSYLVLGMEIVKGMLNWVGFVISLLPGCSTNTIPCRALILLKAHCTKTKNLQPGFCSVANGVNRRVGAGEMVKVPLKQQPWLKVHWANVELVFGNLLTCPAVRSAAAAFVAVAHSLEEFFACQCWPCHLEAASCRGSFTPGASGRLCSACLCCRACWSCDGRFGLCGSLFYLSALDAV